MKARLVQSMFPMFALALISTLQVAAHGQESRAYLHSFNLPGHGVAIEGYSPVSYFAEGKAIRGNKNFAV